MQMLSPKSQRDVSRNERRRYQRFAVRCRCWLESDGTSLFAQTADVGLGGLFLRTAVPLTQGARVQVTLEFGRDGQRVVADGLISRHVRPRSGSRHGMGLELLDIVNGRQHLERLLGR